MHDELGNERRIERPPSAGVEDLVIVPLVVIALAISRLLKAVLSILIYVLDYAFPILLQLTRIPLLTARLIGDGMELLFEGIVRCLPVSRGALIVNPNVKLEVAEAIRDALQMSHDERVTRWQGMIGPGRVTFLQIAPTSRSEVPE